MKNIITFLFLSLLSATAAENFMSKETLVAIYGNGYIRGLREEPKLGVGVGVEHWLTRGLGFGANLETTGFDGKLLDRATGRVLLRAPLWDKIAPYGYAEGGWNLQRDTAIFGTGGGLDYRVHPRVSLFAEAGPEFDASGGKRAVNWAGLRAATGVKFKF